MNLEIRTKDDSVSWQDLADLLHQAFEERVQQGLHFTCSYLTAAELESSSKGSIVMMACDRDSGQLLGTGSMKIEGEGEDRHAYQFNLAVRPGLKRNGISTQLHKARIEIAKSQNCAYILSDTAIGATSSVKWHLKNGFRIIGLHSFYETNYYSYMFRMQLKPHPLWSNPLFCKIHYWLSALKCRATFTANGDSRYLMSLYIKMRNHH